MKFVLVNKINERKNMLEKFKSDSIQMRKEKNPLSLAMITVMSEARMVAKNDGNRELTEQDLVRQIKKTVVNLNATISLLAERNSDYSAQEAEKNMLESYLPKQLSTDEILSIVKQYLDQNNIESPSKRLMGELMTFLKSNYDGQYDGKQASNVISQLLI